MERFNLPTSRLLYSNTKVNEDWMDRLIDLDLAIDDHPRLQRTSNQFHLYFFKPGSETAHDEEIWVAREIAGFVNPGELEAMETYDLLKGTGFGADFPVGPELSLDEIKKYESDLRNADDKPLAPTWRVSFMEKSDGIMGKIGVFSA